MKKRISKLFEFKFELKSFGGRIGLNEEDKGPADYLREGIEHFNNFSKNECIITFEVLIQKFPEYLKGKVIYSSVLERFGNFEKALDVLKDSIKPYEENMDEEQTKRQFILHIETGKLLFRTYRSYGKISQHKYTKKEYLEMALDFFRKAQKFGPKKIISYEMEAECLELMENHAEAVKIWEQLKNKKARFLKRYASSLEFLGDQENSVKQFEKAAENSNDDYAYEKLAFYNKDKQKKAELKQKAVFFKWVPKYVTELQFSQENYGIFQAITNRNKEQSINTILNSKLKKFEMENNYSKFLNCVKSLIENNNTNTTCFLITIIHNHCAGSLVNKAFQELDKRAGEKKIQDMIYSMLLARNKSPCVVKNSIIILAKQKYPKVFDLIIRQLSSDMNIFDKGLPMALAHFGNVEAVEPLISSMSLEFSKKHKNIPSGIASIGHLKLRQKSALALGFFKDTRGLKECRKGLKNKDLRLYCAAALFKMSGDKRWLKPIKSRIKKKDIISFDIFLYLKNHCKDIDELLGEISRLYEEKNKKTGKGCIF